MLLQAPNLHVWLYNQPTDMRNQFDGLAALAQQVMARSASGGDLFVFINRKRTHMKVLYYSAGGFCLWAKRLEQGCFHSVTAEHDGTATHALSWAQLQCLIDGIHWQKSPQSKRYRR